MKKITAYGIKKIAEPIGVIAAVIPTTNPTSTAIFKTLIALKNTKRHYHQPASPCKELLRSRLQRLCLEAAVAAGAPEGIIGWIDVPSLEMTNYGYERGRYHPGNRRPRHGKGGLFQSGKPALGVGAGNTPAIIDDTADILLAVNSIIHSKTFDNGMICASEQSVIVLDKVL